MQNTQQIIDGIFAKAQTLGMTMRQLSDASGVPKSTIERIKRGDTPNPSMQSVLDLAAVVGYQIWEAPQDAAPIPSHVDPVYEERIARMRSHYNMLLAEKSRWITHLFILSLALFVIILCLMALVVFVLIYDFSRPDIGWIREQLAAMTEVPASEFLISLKSFLG